MERFSRRLTNWNEIFMAHAAKDNLIISFSQSLPGYVMGVFKLSNALCEQYQKLIREFWWGDDENKRKVHWLA